MITDGPTDGVLSVYVSMILISNKVMDQFCCCFSMTNTDDLKMHIVTKHIKCVLFVMKEILSKTILLMWMKGPKTYPLYKTGV